MTPDLFRKLAALGLSTDQMAGVLEIMEAATAESDAREEARKAKGRERWHRWQDKRQPNVSQREQTLANNSHASVTRVEDISSNLEISGQEENKREGARTATPRSRGSRLPDDFSPDLSDCQGLSQADAQREAAKFGDYWRAQPGQKGVKVDWPATWRNWCRRAVETRPGTGPPVNGKRTFSDVAMDRMNGHGSAGIFGTNGDARSVSADDSERRSASGDVRGGVAGRYLPSSH